LICINSGDRITGAAAAAIGDDVVRASRAATRIAIVDSLGEAEGDGGEIDDL
jgi:hypothetical protein